MPTPLRQPPGQTLLIDADDTLWENNIYFEEAIVSFISFLEHETHSPEEVRKILIEVEKKVVKTHGYGIAGFRQALTLCFEQLNAAPATPEELEKIASFAAGVRREIELLPQVAAVLPELASRHQVILVTKGHPEDQRDKLSRSGLEPHFAAVEVLAEKHPSAYRELVEKHALSPQRTWMVGNSPRSDINAALEAGLHAVFVPHPHTWQLEVEPLARAPRRQYLLELGSFAELAEFF